VGADEQGLSFDSSVLDYERGRTAWPEAVVEGIDADEVLDLAAGTGKLTRLLVGRFGQVVAVEPLPSMRALGAELAPEATWLDGTAEAIPLDDASMDAAFVAEAFHWFDAKRAGRELARVLRPGAPLRILFTTWNGSFRPGMSPEAKEAFAAVVRRTGPAGGAKIETGAWKEGLASASFASLAERRIGFEHETDRDGMISYYLSISSIAARPQSERDALRNELETLVSEGHQTLSLTAVVYDTHRV
jgi:SAM-dependent methyltransferase